MNTRSQIFGTYAMKIFIAVLVLILSGFLFLRLDASRHRSHSLSRETKKTLRELDDKVVVKVFASDDLPGEFATLNRALKDMLQEFQSVSRGKLKFEYARAKDPDELADEAMQYNIPQMPLPIFEKDRMVSKNIVFGIGFEGMGKAASMPLRPGMEEMLEYQLLKQINKLQRTNLPELSVFADSLALLTQYSLYPDHLATFFLELEENYEVQHTNLQTAPKQTPVMLALGVVDSLSTLQLYNLDQYLMAGGKIVMLQDRAMVSYTSQGTAVTELDSNIFRMLEHYGILIKPNIVLDQDCEIGMAPGQGGQIPYPFFPHLKPAPKIPYTSGFENIVMNIASELALMPGAKLKMEPVLQTSGKSNTLLGPWFDLNEAMRSALEPGSLELPPITVAAEYSGPFKSYFSNALTDSTFHASSDSSKIILFGDSDFNLEFSSGGAYVVLNAVDHLLGRTDMVKLRSFRTSYNRLGADVYLIKRGRQVADPQKAMNRLGNIFKLSAIVLPLLLLALLEFSLLVRRKKF